MNKKEIKYIESDLEGIIATIATCLNFNLDEEHSTMADVKRRTKKEVSRLMYLHKNYKLVKKR